jgi:hypothetical protein
VSWNGQGFHQTALATLTVAVVPPIPSASVVTTIAKKPGARVGASKEND